MLIELGPTQLPHFHRGIDWKIAIGANGLRAVVVLNEHRRKYGKWAATAWAYRVARAQGFVVDRYGNVTNWYDVPHLWEQYTCGVTSDFIDHRR